MNDRSRVLVALRVRASPERAFHAFTAEIGQWWQPNGLFRFDPDRSGTLEFAGGPSGQLLERYADGTSFVVGDVRVWDPPHRLVVGWRQAGFGDDQDTELHVRFEAVAAERGAAQTRVVVEHYGWDGIPPEHEARHGFPLAVFQRRFAEWWQALLGRLDSALAADGA